MNKAKREKRGVRESGGEQARKQERLDNRNIPDSKHMIISQVVYW